MRRFIAAAAAVVLTLGFFGCSGETKDVNVSSESDVTTITWWAFPTFAQENKEDVWGTYEKSLIGEFEEKHKDIKVNLNIIDFTIGPDKLEYAIKNKAECDVLFDAPGRIISYGKRNLLVILDDMFTDEFEQDVNNPELLDACKIDGKPYMYPLSTAPFYMAFNKEYLEDAGVSDLVKEGWTTDDFTKVITALHEKSYISGMVYCDGKSGDQGTRAFMYNLFSSHMINSDFSEYTINDENGKKAFRYVKEMVDNGCLRNGSGQTSSTTIARFVEGNASFTLLWGPCQQNYFKDTLDVSGVEPVEVPFPSDDGTPELEYLINGFCIFNSGDEKKIAASKEFVKFLCDDETVGKKNVIRTGCFPVRNSYGDLYESDRMKKIAEWEKYYGTYYNTVDGFDDMRVYWYESLQALMFSVKSPDECADNFVKLANSTIVKKEKEDSE